MIYMIDFDWTSISDDPNNKIAKNKVKELLVAFRYMHTNISLTGFVSNQVKGKRLLDIGVVSHSARYIIEDGWRHGKLNQSASYCVGIDILESLVNDLNNKGYNIRCVDATSEVDLGEKFDVVFIGDVIEHVENPANLLRFAKRHLSNTGKILVATPNPLSRKFVKQFFKNKSVIVNLDHLAWFTPTMALELARRTDLVFSGYHLIKPFSKFKARLYSLLWKWIVPDYSFPDYLYEFKIKN